MINGTLFRRELKANYKLILIFAAVLTLYCSLVIAMFDPELGTVLTTMAQTMPDLFSAFGMQNTGSTLLSFISNYLYGFIVIVFPSVFIVLSANRLIARYVDRGSMAYLLATPNKRRKIALTQAFFFISCIFALVIYIVLICLISSTIMFPGKLEIPSFLLLNFGLFSLLFFIGGICYFSSCFFNDARYSSGIGGGLVIAFILLQMISQVGKSAEFLKYFTPLTLFQPELFIAKDNKSILFSFILYGIGILLYGSGIFIFEKKDLPL